MKQRESVNFFGIPAAYASYREGPGGLVEQQSNHELSVGPCKE